MFGDYRIVYKKCSMKESEFKEHLRSLMDYFSMQISLIDSYIECSKYI